MQKLIKRFVDLYGGGGEIRVFQAPGRVNLIGEHVDYNGGYVLPAAIGLKSTVVARANGGDRIRLSATSWPETVTAKLNSLEDYRNIPWGSYQLGVAWILRQQGIAVTGCDLLYHCTIPYGGGLSSSAAIEVSTALALSYLAGVPLEPLQAALLSRAAENRYVGVQCGIMDQFASAMCKEGSAVLLNCESMEFEHVPLLLENNRIVIADTNKPRSLAASKYNQRKAECQEALSAVRLTHDVPSLCAATMEQIDGAKMSDTAYRRARHCVSENQRALSAAQLLSRGDLAGFGALMRLSHASLRDDYEVTGPELDAIVGAADGLDYVLGARMTGAGFGGCAIAIVPDVRIDDFIREVGEKYKDASGLVASFYVTEAGGGAGEIAI